MVRIGIFLTAALLLAGESFAAPLRVVTTFLPAYCFAKSIAGSVAEVDNLVPGSVSLHDYQLSPGDIRKIAGADLIVVNGLGLETFLQRAIENTSPETARKVFALSTGLEPELIPEPVAWHRLEPGHDRSYNPHIWLDPKLAMQSVTNLLKAFVARDPDHAAVYRQNAAAYLELLRGLDQELAAGLKPLQNAAFVTFHNAFPYFVRRYDLKLAGVVEQVPEVSPSPKELSHLLEAMREQRVKALYAEPGGSSRLARQIARDTGVALAELDPLETGKLEANAYEEGMRRNLRTLQKTLGQ